MTTIPAQVQTFRDEHRELLRELRQLDLSLSTLSIEKTDLAAVVRALEKLRALISEQIIPHCSKEGHVLWPVLRSGGPDEVKRIRAILIEDEVLKEEQRRLGQVLLELERSGKKRAVEALVGTGERIIRMLIEHIHQEEAFLFPLIEKQMGTPEG
jgi:hemerythrin-like domain-containing protein